MTAEDHVQHPSDEADGAHWHRQYLALEEEIRTLEGFISRFQRYVQQADAVIRAHDEQQYHPVYSAFGSRN